MKNIFTIGYSTFEIDGFIDALKTHKIDVLVDVRSSPYSQYKADFNREHLIRALETKSIHYLFFGDLWGAFLKDSSCYINGQVDFNLASQTKEFGDGLERIKKGLEKYNIVLMCAEKDPITCHRGVWLSRQLQREGIEVQHILFDGNLESHYTSEERLLVEHKLQHQDLFVTRKQRLESAYAKQAKKVAYKDDDPENIDIRLLVD